MQPGAKVWHVAYGAGVVIAVIAGRRVRVRFVGAPELPRTVMLAELSTTGADGRPSVAPATPTVPERAAAARRDTSSRVSAARQVAPAVSFGASPAAVLQRPPTMPAGPLTPELADLRQTLEAMRLGVAPQRHVETFTVGRERELQRVEEMLTAARGFRSVWGGYGAGKTHFLDMAEQLALLRGFAVARVVFDPLEMPPMHPNRLYAALIRELRLPDHRGPALDVLAEALCGSERHRDPDGESFSRFLSPWLHAWHAQDDAAIAEMRDYVRGDVVDRAAVEAAVRRAGWHGPNLLSMSDYRTYGRLYTHLLGTWACWCRDAGYRGLVVLLDEVEFVDSLSAEDRMHAVEVLKHLAAATLPNAFLGFDPEDPEDLYRGGHDVLRRLPLRFEVTQPLGVVFALTPLEELTQAYHRIVRDDGAGIVLKPLDRRDHGRLVSRVVELYGRAYPHIGLPPNVEMRLTREVLAHAPTDAAAVRWIVQRVVSEIDAMRYRVGRVYGT